MHYAVVFAMAVFLLVSYYEFGRSLPVSSGGPWTWFWSIFFFEYKNEALGLTMLAPILYAAVALGWERALAIMALLLVCITPHVIHFAHSPFVYFTSYVFIIIPPIVIMSIEIKLVSDAKERLAREERKRQRAEVIRQLLRAQENERKRIAQELHDTVAQSLLIMATAAHNLLENQAVVDEGVRTDLESMKENSLGLVAEIRAICQGLRPNILDNLGLVPAVKSLVYKTREETGIDVELAVNGRVFELDPEERLAVFRVIQEALSNVTRHAAASSARVALDFDEKGLTVNIDDDGVGFEVESNTSLFALNGRAGLLGMRERAIGIGAGLEITSTAGEGTSITVSVARAAQGESLPGFDRSEAQAVV
ncbi:MAG: sensor histidine kinase [Actinobacteria bacterium]|nr:sensor histidine kinase [Actinomycetota bacterium]